MKSDFKLLQCFLFLLIIGLLALSIKADAFNLPGITKDESLQEHNERVLENEIEYSRDPLGSRPASANKRPWLADNIHDMELPAWPDFGGRNGYSSPVPIGYASDLNLPNLVNAGCAFGTSTPYGDVLINDECDKQIYANLGILNGVVTDINVSGPVTWHVVPGTGAMKIAIQPFKNATYGTTIGVEAFTKSITLSTDGGSDVSEGYCKTSIKLLCEEEEEEYVCPCTDAEPTIVASSSTIAAGGSITVWVDSDGLACPPYEWSISGTGYSLNKTTTNNDLETVTVSLTTGTCGSSYALYSTITVEDACGVTDYFDLRYSGGVWVFVNSVSGGLNTTYVQQYYYRANEGEMRRSLLRWGQGSGTDRTSASVPTCNNQLIAITDFDSPDFSLPVIADNALVDFLGYTDAEAYELILELISTGGFSPVRRCDRYSGGGCYLWNNATSGCNNKYYYSKAETIWNYRLACP